MRSALFEAGFVVLGVVLALAANEWRQSVIDRRQGERALANIIEELEDNHIALAGSQEYHSGLMELIWSEHEEGWMPEPRKDFPRGFVNPARISRTAWRSASETGALALIDYETVIEISHVYAALERYEAQSLSIGELIYGKLFEGGHQSIVGNYRNLGSIISTFRYRENELLEVIDETLSSVQEGR